VSPADEIEAGIRCECGVLVEGHPPLSAPRPWGHGRPCSRELGYSLASGGSGRNGKARTPGETSRIKISSLATRAARS
jgi:hypothetical protein